MLKYEYVCRLFFQKTGKSMKKEPVQPTAYPISQAFFQHPSHLACTRNASHVLPTSSDC